MDRAVHLKNFLGPVLVQLPPNWKKKLDRLRAFIEITDKEVRWAIEIRDPDWFSTELYELLQEFNLALVIHDMIPDHPLEVTADWMYSGSTGKLQWQLQQNSASNLCRGY